MEVKVINGTWTQTMADGPEAAGCHEARSSRCVSSRSQARAGLAQSQLVRVAGAAAATALSQAAACALLLRTLAIRVFGHAPQSERTFFSEVIASMSDVKFSRDGRYVMARDYMTLKIWDVAMEARPTNRQLTKAAQRAKFSWAMAQI